MCKISKLSFFTILALILFSHSVAWTAAPTLIQYRGYLADKPGTQSVQIEFNLYDVEIAGTPLWTETQPVELFDGNFAILLGSSTPLTPDLFEQPNRYLGVTVVGEEELTPRQQIVTVPYAFQSDVSDSALLAEDASQLGGVDATEFVQRNSTAWMQKLGISTTEQTNDPSALLRINVAADDPNGNGILITGAPDQGDLGLRLSNFGTGGYNWFINSTNDNSTNKGGGKLLFMRFTRRFIPGPIIPGPIIGQGTEKSNAENPTYDTQQVDSAWTEILTLDGNERRVGVLTAFPSQTLDVAGPVIASQYLTRSDEQFKEQIEDLEQPIETIKHLRGVQYEWNRGDNPDLNFPDGKQLGLVAQEVESVLPEAVTTSKDGYKSVDYSKIIPLLIESIKQQQKQIEHLQSQLNQLESKQ